MTSFRARHFESGKWIRLKIGGGRLNSVEEEPEAPPDASPSDDWVAPAFWDIQLNGRWGVSFSDPSLRAEQVSEVVRAQAELGTAKLCPTLITAPFDSFCEGLRAIDRACEDDPDIARRVVGVHLEGPYISPVDGFRGAHPFEAVRPPDWDEFRRFQDAAGGRVVLITLAPEHPGACQFIERVVGSGVAVALGHTSADGPMLRAAADAGASLSTHLGNGIASSLPRHPNPIWEQASIDRLSASFIADGHHIDPATLKVLVRAKTPERVILVSDASPLAGLPPGDYGEWSVHPSGKIVVAGTPYLAGSNQALEVGLNSLMRATGLGVPAALATVTAHPARLLVRPVPRIETGEPADLVRYRLGDDGNGGVTLNVLATCVGGEWTQAGDGRRRLSA